MSGGLRTGCLSPLLMPKRLGMILLCSFVLGTPLYSQEVIVARERKPEVPKPTAPPAEKTPSELIAPERTREPQRTNPKTRKRSESAQPTLEQMRKAGALAAERLNNPNPSPARRSGQSDSEKPPAPSAPVPETPRPARREPRSEHTSTSSRSSQRSSRPDMTGAVRPTFIESGRSEPSTSPLPPGQTPRP